MKRLYYDMNKQTGQIRGTLILSDGKALDLLLGGNFHLKPAGWKLSELVTA